jgi:hypothetical protein
MTTFIEDSLTKTYCPREEDSIPLADDDPSALLDESITDFLHEDIKKVDSTTEFPYLFHYHYRDTRSREKERG